MIPKAHEIFAERNRKIAEPRVISGHPAQARLDIHRQAVKVQERLPPLSPGLQAACPQSSQGALDGTRVILVRACRSNSLGHRRERAGLSNELVNVVAPGVTNRSLLERHWAHTTTAPWATRNPRRTGVI